MRTCVLRCLESERFRSSAVTSRRAPSAVEAYYGSITALLRLYYGSITALLRLYYGSIKASSSVEA